VGRKTICVQLSMMARTTASHVVSLNPHDEKDDVRFVLAAWREWSPLQHKESRDNEKNKLKIIYVIQLSLHSIAFSQRLGPVGQRWILPSLRLLEDLNRTPAQIDREWFTPDDPTSIREIFQEIGIVNFIQLLFKGAL
jgi:hypothetical protein